MSKTLRWGVLGIAATLILGLVVRSHYVLDSQKLDAAIKTELPPGMLKAQVIQFIQARKPQFCDDLAFSGEKCELVGRRCDGEWWDTHPGAFAILPSFFSNMQKTAWILANSMFSPISTDSTISSV